MTFVGSLSQVIQLVWLYMYTKTIINRAVFGQVVLALQVIYGDQMETSARPSPDRDFESRNLYCSLSLCDKYM